ncbi:unnamed protein product [Aphis gossypii]|uniref:Uncharacterized protein n=1 Tax=Aphis gossypii TaxID=80765 RepID=A0A9P0NMP3_APHGO|nr:unnamed protein product [Aphis gossypii]
MDLQTILRARNPETLELAMQMARQLEIEFNFNKELQNNENKINQNGNQNFNGNRWSNNYQGNNPNGKNFDYKQNFNHGQNRQNPNNYNNFNRNNNSQYNNNNYYNSNVKPITCSYCDKIGHDSVNCYSKQRDEHNNVNRTRNGQLSNGNGVPNNGRNGGVVTQQCFTIVSVISENHVTLQSPNFKTNTIDLLLNTGSEINLIKINKLTGKQ